MRVGKPCSDKAFSEQLSCPLCDNVLPKDGIAQVNLNPTKEDLTTIAAETFGFETRDMLQVLQLNLDFWALQKNNDSLKYAHDANAMKQKLDHVNKQHSKLVKVCNVVQYLNHETPNFPSFILTNSHLYTIFCALTWQTLEEERLKKDTLQHENESLKGLISEIEAKYAGKARYVH